MRYLNIQKDLIPYSFQMSFNQRTHQFFIDYNKKYDFFTVDLLIDGQPIVLGEKIVYAQPLFSSVASRIDTQPTIYPLDLSSQHDSVTFENFNEQVFLFLLEEA